MIGRQLEAEHFVFGLVPAAHDVNAKPAGCNMIDGRELLGCYQRMQKCRVGGREHGDAAGLREQAGSPRDGFQ